MTERPTDPTPGGKRRTRRSARRPAGPPQPPDAGATPSDAADTPAAGVTGDRAPHLAPATPPHVAEDAHSTSPQVVPAVPPATPAGRTRRQPRGRSESAAERTLRSLVSSRPTQLSPTVAMRAREVATPTEQDLAEAERDLMIVRRNYVPPAPLHGSSKGRSGGKRGDRRRAGDRKRQDGKTGAEGSAS